MQFLILHMARQQVMVVHVFPGPLVALPLCFFVVREGCHRGMDEVSGVACAKSYVDSVYGSIVSIISGVIGCKDAGPCCRGMVVGTLLDAVAGCVSREGELTGGSVFGVVGFSSSSVPFPFFLAISTNP